MGRIAAVTKQKLEQSLPTAKTTVASARAYMAQADIQTPQFAKLCGYSQAAVQQFLQGRYTDHRESDLLIRQAIEEAMRRHPVGVMGTASNGKLYQTSNVVQIREIFDYCHKHQSLAFVYGPPGSQKTFVLEHLVAEFNRREIGTVGTESDTRNRAYLVRASIDIRPRDLVAKICREVGAHSGCTLQGCMSGLRQHLRGTRTIVVLDEAQLCGIPALEALRELHDTDPKLGILLAGSHGLKQFFDTRAAELEQWNSRLHAGIELTGVSDANARAILKAECPDLPEDMVADWIEKAKVPDAYSRDRKKMYLSVRRLFRGIEDFQRLSADAAEAAA